MLDSACGMSHVSLANGIHFQSFRVSVCADYFFRLKVRSSDTNNNDRRGTRFLSENIIDDALSYWF